MSEDDRTQQNVEDSDDELQEQAKRMAAEAQREKDLALQMKSKYPNVKGPAGSALLQKRLHRGQKQKFFDSGDYNMAKARMKNTSSKPVDMSEKLISDCEVGEEIPTPESVHHKSSHLQSKLAAQGCL